MAKGLKEEQTLSDEGELEVVSSEKKDKTMASIDTEKVEFTEGMKFMWRGNVLEFKRGDIVKVSKELRDVLLTRECITLKP